MKSYNKYILFAGLWVINLLFPASISATHDEPDSAYYAALELRNEIYPLKKGYRLHAFPSDDNRSYYFRLRGAGVDWILCNAPTSWTKYIPYFQGIDFDDHFILTCHYYYRLYEKSSGQMLSETVWSGYDSRNNLLLYPDTGMILRNIQTGQEVNIFDYMTKKSPYMAAVGANYRYSISKVIDKEVVILFKDDEPCVEICVPVEAVGIKAPQPAGPIEIKEQEHSRRTESLTYPLKNGYQLHLSPTQNSRRHHIRLTGQGTDILLKSQPMTQHHLYYFEGIDFDDYFALSYYDFYELYDKKTGESLQRIHASFDLPHQLMLYTRFFSHGNLPTLANLKTGKEIDLYPYITDEHSCMWWEYPGHHPYSVASVTGKEIVVLFNSPLHRTEIRIPIADMQRDADFQ